MWKRFLNWWLVFRKGEPCPKHPGHRVYEFDAELATGCAMIGPMCELCYQEMEEECRKWAGSA